MPEELNRLVTDALADFLWTPSPDADENLLREGVMKEKIERVGNIMIDSYELLREKIEAEHKASKPNLELGFYGVVTLHRPAMSIVKKHFVRLSMRWFSRVSDWR